MGGVQAMGAMGCVQAMGGVQAMGCVQAMGGVQAMGCVQSTRGVKAMGGLVILKLDAPMRKDFPKSKILVLLLHLRSCF
jgi:hypothetical protein